MNKQNRMIDEASDESFPASDPPSFTPTTGAGDPHTQVPDELVVTPVGDKLVVHVGDGRGVELCEHLASQGINADCNSVNDSMDRVETIGVDAEVLQAIVDQWEG